VGNRYSGYAVQEVAAEETPEGVQARIGQGYQRIRNSLRPFAD
jgi:hypothetical protein